MRLAQEINRLTEQSKTSLDDLAHDSLDFVLDTCSANAETLSGTFETISDGLKKVIKMLSFNVF